MSPKKIGIYAGLSALFSFLLLLSVAAGEDGAWTHLFTRDGIDVYRKTYPETAVCAFMGVGYVDADIRVVGSVLRDIHAYPQWMDRCKASVILKAVDRQTTLFYSIVDTPPPFKDRDMVLSNKSVFNTEQGTAEFIFQLCDQEIVPPQKDYFRVTELSGKYFLESVAADKTRVTFSYRGNPGGNIPITIANWLESKHYPHAIIMGLREMAKKEKYLTSARADMGEEGNL